jgi:hypothetical protein
VCEGDFSPNLDNSSTCQTSEPVASGRALQPRAASRHLSQAGAAGTEVHSSSHLRHPKEQSLPTDLLERRVVTLNRRVREQGEGRRSRKAPEDSAPTRIPLALRLSFRLGPNVPALRHSRRPVRGALHLLRSAERSRLQVIDDLSLEPGSQGPGRQRLRHPTGPRRVTPATLSGTVNQTDRFAGPVLGVATNPGIIRASARPQDREIAGIPSPAWLFRLKVRVAFPGRILTA